MANLILAISKSNVYEEVAKTTAYIGSKNIDSNGKSAYEQMFVTESDSAMIDRFYDESVNTLMNLLKRFITEIVTDDGNVNWSMTMPNSFVTRLEQTINSSAFSFLVNSIVSKWCEITDKEKVEEYAGNAAALLQDIKDKVFYRSAPTRVRPSK